MNKFFTQKDMEYISGIGWFSYLLTLWSDNPFVFAGLFVFITSLYFIVKYRTENNLYGKNILSKEEFEARSSLGISKDLSMTKIHKILTNYCEGTQKTINVFELEKKYNTTFSNELAFLIERFPQCFVVNKQMALVFNGNHTNKFTEFKDELYKQVYLINSKIQAEEKELNSLLLPDNSRDELSEEIDRIILDAANNKNATPVMQQVVTQAVEAQQVNKA